MKMREIVWLLDERVRGEVLVRGAYCSYIKYTHRGMDYEVWVENDDFEVWEEHTYESE